MKALILALMTWASAQTGLPVPEVQPIVKHATAEQMWHMARPGTEYDAAGSQQYLGLYANGVMWLRDDWSVESVRDVSILLHEVVHHMQEEAGQEYPCRGASERVAHEAQFAWLEAAGLDPFETIGINGLYYVMVTTCGPAWAR
jgi:hypothetical protein